MRFIERSKVIITVYDQSIKDTIQESKLIIFYFHISRDAFNVLLIAAMVTVKMWEDYGINSATVEDVLGIPRKKLRDMERKFLRALNYELFIADKEMEEFVSREPEVVEAAISLFS